MSSSVLRTSVGDIPLHEYVLRVDGLRWTFLHTGAMVTVDAEQKFLGEEDRLPYGVMLWPSSIALAHELVSRRASLPGQKVLELGAGTGVPGIVAATLGAAVTQTDKSDVALHLAKMNIARNRTTGIEPMLADWTEFTLTDQFDLIVGADVLYADTLHPHLRAICERSLAPGGTVLFSDPFRRQSLPLIEAMAADGWKASFSKWTIELSEGARAIALYELTR